MRVFYVKRMPGAPSVTGSVNVKVAPPSLLLAELLSPLRMPERQLRGTSVL